MCMCLCIAAVCVVLTRDRYRDDYDEHTQEYGNDTEESSQFTQSLSAVHVSRLQAVSWLTRRGEDTQHKTRCIYTPTETQPSQHNLSCYVWHFGHLAYNLIQILNYTFLMSSFSLIVKLSDVLLPVCMTCALVGNLKLLNPYRDSWENLFSNIPGHDLIWQFHSVTEIFISC